MVRADAVASTPELEVPSSGNDHRQFAALDFLCGIIGPMLRWETPISQCLLRPKRRLTSSYVLMILGRTTPE
jgi:hypothetical protein